MQKAMQLKVLPKVDTYVIKSVLSFLIMASLSVCFLVGVIDSFEKMDEFLGFAERENYGFFATVYLVIMYYLCLTPQYFIQYMIPFICMLSGVIVISVMSSHREFTALRASGVPLQRVLLPIMLTVFVVGTFIFTFRDAILPSIVREANEISLLIKPRGGKPVTIILTDEENGTINTYMMGHFDSLKKVAYNFRLEKRKIEDWKQGKTNIYEVYTGDKATLDGDIWRFGMNPRHYLKGYYEERELPIGNIKTAITPAMLEQQSLGLAVMTSGELSAFPNDVTKMIELAQRRAAPFASVVIMLVAASFILHRERENPGSAVGRVKSIVMALLICAGFYLIQGIFVSFAEAEWIGPNLASWAPNIVFGIWGGHAFRHVNL